MAFPQILLEAEIGWLVGAWSSWWPWLMMFFFIWVYLGRFFPFKLSIWGLLHWFSLKDGYRAPSQMARRQDNFRPCLMWLFSTIEVCSSSKLLDFLHSLPYHCFWWDENDEDLVFALIPTDPGAIMKDLKMLVAQGANRGPFPTDWSWQSCFWTCWFVGMWAPPFYWLPLEALEIYYLHQQSLVLRKVRKVDCC